MKQNKALKVRIYPNAEQTEQINKTLGCARAIFNMMLHERITFFEENKNDTRSVYEHTYKTEKQYKEELQWLKEADSQALQQARIDLSNAFSNFFKSLQGIRKGQKIGFPSYKKKKTQNSYRSCIVGKNIEINFEDRKIKIPKVGWVSFRDQRTSCEGRIKSIVVSRSTTGKYFASLLFEYETEEVNKAHVTDPERVIGLDMSLENFYVDHEGYTPGYQRNTIKYENQLALAQRRMSTKKKGSQNWYKAKRRVSIVHEKIANSRTDFNRKLATELVTKYDAVCIETLSLKGMSQELKLGKSVHDLGYSEFVSRLKQKAERTGCHVIQADQWFASSKLCNICGYKNSALQLHERRWTCPQCKAEHSRDENAGKNLRNVGLHLLGLGKPPKFVEKMLDVGDLISMQSSEKQKIHGFSRGYVTVSL